MIKFFLILLQVFLVLIISLIVVNNSFVVSVEIRDYIYSTSSSYVFMFLIIILLFFFLAQNFYFKSKFLIKNYKINKKIKMKEKGYNSFVTGMIALANKDYKSAINESKKIEQNLNEEPSLYLLLKAQTYKHEKKYDKLTNVYEEMTKNKSTGNLGYRGLMEQYLMAQDYHHAFIYGEKLFNNNPNIEKIYETLVNIVVKINNWHQLIIITDKAYSNNLINKKQYQENKSVAYFEIAKIKKLDDAKESLSAISKALKLRENFVPYINLYLDILIEDNQIDYAKKYIKKIWKKNPHPEYKNCLIILSEKLKIDYLELVKFITGNSPQDSESKILLIEAFIANKRWSDARNLIIDLLDVQPKKEVCLLMAKIEEGENGDIQKKNSWILRARNGQENNIWVCVVSKKQQKTWTSISIGGYFNSLEWKKPFMLNQDNFLNTQLIYENT